MLSGWSTIDIAGKRADVFYPPGGLPRFALLYLHTVGEESLADNPTYTAALADRRLACCVPHGKQSWWSDRVCPDFDPVLTTEKHLIDNVLPWMAAKWPELAGKPIGVFGISMGGQGAIRLGFRYSKLFPVVAGVSSAFDYHDWYGRGTPIDDMYRSKEACRQDTAILQIRPPHIPPHIWFACDPDDEWHRGNDRLHEKLQAIGIAHTSDLSTRHGGHSWDYFDSKADTVLSFLVENLEKQNRRLM